MKTESKALLWLTAASPLFLGACLLLGASEIGLPDLDTATGRAILGLRANRIIEGFFVGAALSCSGVVFQAILRNPLAEPYILGVSSGAGLGAAVCILTGITVSTIFVLPASAFVAAAITLAIVFMLAKRGGGTPSVYGLILSGVIISAICSSILMFLVSTASAEGLHSVIWWMLGNLQPTSLELLVTASVVIAIGCACTMCLCRELNALTLGNETAYHVGIRTDTTIVFGLGLATAMTAAAVSMSGLIGFVGLIVPHVMRSLVGPDHRKLIPASALMGGVFLALCDGIARSVMAYEIPVGVITAMCGGPFFLMILTRKRKQGWIE